ncbi:MULTISPECIES: DUF1127 domain-containing protein [Mesorhizobium]|uniref:DUF1127 domain-containing protein n=4 Tax=Mesorhizobium TaxID=68287 RepID=A0A1A5JDV7_RHILI|nr:MULTISPECIES: DUF1127 domain-containing protein [Mesorhizobium]MBE1710769.1 DUF1127 domain-containing protein [Mesorhizobium japonicum]MBE1715631.1 DUF1127 domain-containing protein [Mesorhizobium japonicum]MUT23151.1 DUF1127 domain-containing protein [Mesorhizobium japonicum]MUT30083.1 DUF1127 domain-containing protein [Mesorhizobium japonicum]OBP68687.1 DUF1127 domain-containing protein [Mesorhizobium loti]
MTLTLGPIGAAMSGLAMRSTAAFERRRALRRISRFSDRRLKDIGLERDWDGSILGNPGNGRGI